MSRRTQENVVAALILLIFIAAIVASLQYGPRARMVPIPIAALGIVLIMAQLVLQNLRSEKDLTIDLLEVISARATGFGEAETTSERPGGGAEATESSGGGRFFAAELKALGVVLVLLVLFLLIGPLPAMFLFTAGYFVLSRHYSIARGVIYAAACTLAVYAVFSLWLRVDLMRGYLDMSFGLM